MCENFFVLEALSPQKGDRYRLDTALKKYTDFLTMPLQRNTHNTNRLHQIIAKDRRKMQPINNFSWQKKIVGSIG